MIKQKYITPRVEIVDIDVPQSMLVASGETDSTGTGGGPPVGDETEDLSTTRRGTWGNLWD